MKTVELGATGVMVSELCLGTMMFADRGDYAGSEAIVNAALAHGINFVDTAAMYSSGVCEEFLGRILKGKRDQVFLGTKVVKGIDRQSILSGLDESLARLQTDRVDLYMIHWPVQGMDVAEVMQALNDIVVSGKALLCRLLQLSRLARGAFERHRRTQRLGQAGLQPGGIQPDRARRRGRDPAAGGRREDRDHSVSSARDRTAGGEIFDHHADARRDACGKTDSRVITWLSQHGSSIDRLQPLCQRSGRPPGQPCHGLGAYSDAVTCPIVGVSSLRQLEETIQGADVNLTAGEYEALTDLFNTEVKEEGLQLFPGLEYNFPRLRRNLRLVGPT